MTVSRIIRVILAYSIPAAISAFLMLPISLIYLWGVFWGNENQLVPLPGFIGIFGPLLLPTLAFKPICLVLRLRFAQPKKAIVLSALLNVLAAFSRIVIASIFY